MTLTTSNSHGIVVPDQLGDLVIAAAARASIALRASTVVTTASREYRVPVLSGLPSSSFVAEGQELSLNDAVIEELTIIPAKIGHVAPLSRELVRDSFNDGAPEIVATAQGIDIARKVDEAFFGGNNTIANDGLQVLADVQEVDAGTVLNLDAFAAAQSLSEDVGGIITSFVANPETALTLAQLKRSDDSNEPLLQASVDPTQPTARMILGSQLLVSTAVDPDVIWAVPQLHSLVVIREDVETVVSEDVYFTSDRLAVKTTARLGWGFPHPGSVVKINLAVS